MKSPTQKVLLWPFFDCIKSKFELLFDSIETHFADAGASHIKGCSPISMCPTESKFWLKMIHSINSCASYCIEFFTRSDSGINVFNSAKIWNSTQK